MFSGKFSYKFLIFPALSLILSNCSVERNTGSTRFYHSLTAHYNIYFNGYESYKAGVARITKGYRDDYSELLRVFESSDPSTVSLCSSDMERAIQKASKLIALKSITAKPEFDAKKELTPQEKTLLEQKEYNKWVDDSYYLIGMARFYKHEFNEATSVFDYCIAEANDPEIKIKSSIWLARISNETGNFVNSKRLLSGIEIKTSDSRAVKALYYTTLADMFIRQKMYSESTEPLTRSLRYVKGKSERYRRLYLLAQLHERAGESQKATELYREVIRMNPPYDVEFNARINIAGVFDVNSGKPSELARELEKMLRDSKNKDYSDQIYYALGNMMMKEGKTAEAISYYRKSASAGKLNLNQKGKSYLALADLYYSKPDYLNAGRFYDSTVYFLDQKYPDYKAIRVKAQNLNDLTRQLLIIQKEDSLQRVAKMSKSERDALIQKIIAGATRDEREGKTSDYAGRAAIGQYYENARRSQNTIDQEGKWYFYNQAALTFGRTEFRRRWGERRLEDNWRRSNKNVVNVQMAAAGQEEGAHNGSDTSKSVKDYKKPEYYLKNLPLNDSLIAISNGRIADAYFEAGKVFSDKISDKVKAAESFEVLINKFPDNPLVPEALYNLYSIFRESNNVKAETYRQRLLEKYPDSEFSKILSDPDYYSKKTAAMKLAEKLYNDAYNAYDSEHFDEAIKLCNEALDKMPKDDLAPRFMLLRAYSTARISDERTFKEELNKVIKAWPGTAESKKASELAAYLNQKLPELKTEEDRQIATELYTADTTSVYVFATIITDPTFNVNQASFDVISYNIDNFTNKNYRTEGILVENKYVMITVTGFSDNRQAWEYYDAFDAGKHIRNSSGKNIMTFLISNNNLQILNKDKNPERYFIFFKEKYLTGRKNR